MSWHYELLPDDEHLADYERRFAELVEGSDVVALCQYDAGARVPAGMLADVAAAHSVDLSPELALLSRSGSLSAARVQDGRVLRLAGELDFLSAETLATVLDAHFHGPLIVDLSDLGFVDVTGLRALRGRHDRTLTISGASGAVRRLLGLLAWDTDPAVVVVNGR
jgi:anti-anti-sigma factor